MSTDVNDEDPILIQTARDLIGKSVHGKTVKDETVTGRVIGFDPKPPKHPRGIYLVLQGGDYIDLRKAYEVI